MLVFSFPCTAFFCFFFFFSSRRRHTRSYDDWSSDVCSSDLIEPLLNCHKHDYSGSRESQREIASVLENSPGATICQPMSPTFLSLRRIGIALAFAAGAAAAPSRSEERRVGKECRSRRSPCH